MTHNIGNRISTTTWVRFGDLKFWCRAKIDILTKGHHWVQIGGQDAEGLFVSWGGWKYGWTLYLGIWIPPLMGHGMLMGLRQLAAVYSFYPSFAFKSIGHLFFLSLLYQVPGLLLPLIRQQNVEWVHGRGKGTDSAEVWRGMSCLFIIKWFGDLLSVSVLR